jgi:bifunctional non-homologous end joining protein LigD
MRRAPLLRPRPATATRRPGTPVSVIPASVTPQLATLAGAPPAGGDWHYEIKYDGYRLLARIAGGKVRLLTRNGVDWTERLPRLALALAALELRDTWLDGEIVVRGAHGVPSFQALQNALEAGSDAKVVYFAFDLLYLRGRDLRRQPLRERKRELARALGEGAGAVQYSGDLAGDIEGALAHACRLGLEGLIAKRADAPYVGGRTRTWLKLKCRPRQEFVIGGYTAPGGSRHGFGALLLGYHDDGGRLRYAGRVGTGFDGALLSRIAARLGQLERATSPFEKDDRRLDVRGVRWVRPVLVAEVEFTGWTDRRLVRQASFVALRTDKPADAVQLERAAPVRPRASADPAAQRATRVAGVTITHSQRLIWPAESIDKAALARYYERVGPWLLPHLKCRPLSLMRCPDGAAAQCFFQRHMGPARPQGVKTFVWERSTQGKSYLFVTAVPAVIQLVQHGMVELHTWGALLPRPSRPDRITIDLDPDPALPWVRLAEGAQLVRTLVEELGLAAFLKTTGGKGVHVVVPLERRHGWEEVKSFSRAMADHLAHVMPDRFTASLAKRRRAGRIFVDYLRNGEAATAVAAYSARARPGAPVSMPIEWDDLAEDLRGSRFNVTNVPDLLSARRRDPWAGYAAASGRLTRGMLRALGVPMRNAG